VGSQFEIVMTRDHSVAARSFAEADELWKASGTVWSGAVGVRPANVPDSGRTFREKLLAVLVEELDKNPSASAQSLGRVADLPAVESRKGKCCGVYGKQNLWISFRGFRSHG
jgi:hypothetical protein